MISLISRWKLKNGCPPELQDALKKIAGIVEANEPDTFMYAVHLSSFAPLDSGNQPIYPSQGIIPLEKQTEVVFFEIYKDAAAFARHVQGPTFTHFLENNLQFFREDPNKPGWPITETIFLDRQSAFIRDQAKENVG